MMKKVISDLFQGDCGPSLNFNVLFKFRASFPLRVSVSTSVERRREHRKHHRKRKLAEFLQLGRYSDETMIKFP